MKQKLFFFVFINFFIICFKQSILNSNDLRQTSLCHDDLLHNTSVCKLVCAPGNFALSGMKSCHPWLSCDAEITLLYLLSASVVKTVYLAEWRGYNIVLSVLSSLKYKDDFLHNLYMIQSLSPHNFVVQLLGVCGHSLMTEYFELGNALHVEYHLNHSLKLYDSVKTRLKLCINYASIIQFLHGSPVGKRVMCDSSTLEKTLSQFLITLDINLVVNDLDATPLVDPSKGGIHCGNKQLTGSFIAPEQAWPYPERNFSIIEMPLYNEKTDIFKIPDVCNWFLGSNPTADFIKYKLFKIHKSCKNSDPHQRPDAETVVKVYENLLHDIL